MFLTLIQLSLFFFLLTNIVSRSGSYFAVMLGIVLGLLYIIIHQTLEGRNLLDMAIDARVETQLGDQNDYAFMLSVGVNLLFWNLISSSKKWYVWIGSLIFVAIFTLENIIASGSRAGLIYLIISFGYFLYFAIKSAKPITRLILGLTSIVAFFNLYIILINSPHFRRLLTLFKYFQNDKIKLHGRSIDTSAQERANLLEQAYGFWLERPVFGWGLDQFRYIKPGRNTFSHNNFLELLCNHGVFGLVIYYSMYLYIFFLFIKVYKLSNKAPIVIWTSSLIFMTLFRDLVHVNYYNKLQIIVLSLILGMLLYTKKKYTSLKPNYKISV